MKIRFNFYKHTVYTLCSLFFQCPGCITLILGFFSAACKPFYWSFMFSCPNAVITLKAVSVSMHTPVLSSASVCVFMCVLGVGWSWGVATQTEATLISVLESNLASVQNGSLYQLGGSLPCLESGGSSSSGSRGGSSDAFLVTALKEQADDHLL